MLSAALSNLLRPTTDANASLRYRKLVDACLADSDRLQGKSNQDLRDAADRLRWQAKTGANPQSLVQEGFALVRETARRQVGLAHYDVQLSAAITLLNGDVAEMQTGEGKTLTALLPAWLYSLYGRGSHMVTANDYLAGRDAEFARQILTPLGTSVGGVTSSVPPELRRPEYECEITYGTSREFGFDFLRDRVESDRCQASALGDAVAKSTMIQRGQFFALVDEADSVLLDDALTPLVLSQPIEVTEQQRRQIVWFDELSTALTVESDYYVHPDRMGVELTLQGRHRVANYPRPSHSVEIEFDALLEGVTNALIARTQLRRDRDYIVDDEQKIAIVDATTGRLSDGRKWREGLHQAIETKEGVELTDGTGVIAQITVQSYFLKYNHLSGLTGTARTAARELRRVYSFNVAQVPTAKPCRRVQLPPRVFASELAKLDAIVEDVQHRQRSGGATLVGTPSVIASISLSQKLAESGIEHQVLNCRAHDREAAIVAEAGKPGRVTIATNMAGRGTDIRVDPAVLAQGGLHVLSTQMHNSARIDRQLIGRTARQGEPGSCQLFLSLDDELMAHANADELTRLRERSVGQAELSAKWYRWFARLQVRLERRAERQRRQLLKAEQARQEACIAMGLDPVIESAA